MNIEKILGHNITILTGNVSSGKTMTSCNIIKQALIQYKTPWKIYGLNPEITEFLVQSPRVMEFYRIEDFDQFHDSFILVDEVDRLFDISNRKRAREMDLSLGQIAHRNNRVVLVSRPQVFVKWVCSHADLFAYKTTTIKSLINRSRAQDMLKTYGGRGLTATTVNVPIDEVLCMSESDVWFDDVELLPEFDSKSNNKNLFIPR